MGTLPMNDQLTIKFGSQYGPEEEAAVLRVLRENAPTSGETCVAFERQFAEYCGTKYARVVSNGTAALFLSMLGLDIKPGDRVITTPMTWIATAAAPATLGAEIDFVDVDPVTYNLDPAQLEAAITPETKAIIPVHLYGQCADMDAILAIARRHGIPVVEDACHAIGAEYKGRKAGALGAAGCFSFHEQKNISTLGEGGIVVTDDPDLFERVALYRSHCTRVHGGNTKYCALDPEKFPLDKKFWWQDFDDCGYNFRMTDIQAAVGIEQLKKLDVLNQRRIDNAAYLSEGLKDVAGIDAARDPVRLQACVSSLPGHDRFRNVRHVKRGLHLPDAAREGDPDRLPLHSLALVHRLPAPGLPAGPVPRGGIHGGAPRDLSHQPTTEPRFVGLPDRRGERVE